MNQVSTTKGPDMTNTPPKPGTRTTRRSPKAAVRGLVAGCLVLAIGATATPVSAAPPEPAFPFAMGMTPAKTPIRKGSAPQVAAAATANAVALPASVDLTQWAVPTGYQGAVGSCVAWAVAYTTAGWYANKLGTAGVPFAPMSVYSIHTNGRNSPTEISGMVSTTMSSGIDMLSDYPQGNFDYATLPTPAQRQMAANFKFTGWTDIFRNSFSKDDMYRSLKTELAASRPVMLGMSVYSNFGTLNATNYKYSEISGSLRGGHAVVALGYDDFGVLIQNSWGTGWGKDGFAWVSWPMIGKLTTRGISVTGADFAPKDVPAPDITSFSASSALYSGGSTITVNGTNLKRARFSFDGVLEPVPTVNAAGTQATITLAATARVGTGTVVVDTPTGKDTDRFTFTGPAPSISSIAPATGTGAGGTKVLIKGSGLQAWADGQTQVKVGSTVVPFTKALANGSQLEITMPPAANGLPGTVDITVTTSQGTTTKAGAFTYSWPYNPTLTMTAPTQAPIGDVKLAARFTKPGSVGVAGITVTFQSHVIGTPVAWETIGTAVTDNAGNAGITVRASASTEYRFVVAGGVVSRAATVTIKPIGVLTALSSTSGPKAGGGNITITGSYLTGQTVYFGTLSARVVSASAASAVVQVPKSSTIGAVQVSAKNAMGVSNTLTFTYV